MAKSLNKNYLLITPSISNLGGAQLYILRRAKYLICQGFSVKVIISHHNGDNFILKDQFLEIPTLFLNQLRNPISFYSKKKIDLIVSTILDFVKGYNGGIIESSSLETAIWGELISSKYNLKHIVYLLAEPRAYKFYFNPGYDFFLFKLNRREIFGTTEYSLPLIFGKKIENDENNFVNIPFDPGELVEFSIPSLKFENVVQNSFVIGTITRLEKPYLIPFIESCIRFAEKHKDKRITLIIAGGSENVRLFDILNNRYKDSTLIARNLSILFTGYIKNLGRDFFKVLDVFVGMGTASINAISQACPTLNIDPNTNECSGIFGLDTDNFAYPKNGKIYSVEDKLEALISDIQLMKTAKLEGVELFSKKYSIKSCFTKLDKLIYLSDKDHNYFPFSFSWLDRIKDRLRYFKGHVKTKIFKFLIFIKIIPR